MPPTNPMKQRPTHGNVWVPPENDVNTTTVLRVIAYILFMRTFAPTLILFAVVNLILSIVVPDLATTVFWLFVSFLTLTVALLVGFFVLRHRTIKKAAQDWSLAKQVILRVRHDDRLMHWLLR